MKRIYCSLDELLDTRLGLISTYYPDKAEYYLKPDIDDYYLRLSDDDIYQNLNMTNKDWFDLWKTRNNDVLHNSVKTYIPEIIQSVLMDYHSLNEHAIDDLDVTLTINTYPYYFSENDKRILEGILEKIIPLASSIHFVEVSLIGVTPNYLKQNYDYIFMYDFNNWVTIHQKAFKELVMADIHFFVPKLFIRNPEEEKWTEDEEAKRIIELDPFKVMESMLSPKVGITFIPASDFSAALRDPIVQKEKIKDLDWMLDQPGSYTRRIFQYDPQYQFPQG